MNEDENEILEGGEEQEVETTTTEATQSAPAIDYDKLGQVIGNAVKQDTQPTQLSEAELMKKLGVWEPDDAFLGEFSNPETQLKAFAKMRDGMMQSNMRLLQVALENQRKQLDAEYAPIRSHYQEQQVERAFSRFNSQYPQLKDEKLRPFIQQAAAQIAQSSPNLPEKELFAAVANRVAGAIQATNPDFKLTTGGSPGLATTTRGAGGGGSKGAGTKSNAGGKAPSVASLLLG